MKFILLVAVVIALVIMSEAKTSYSDPDTEWANFKTTFGKQYAGDEETLRGNIFKEHLRKIIQHNEKYDKGEVTFRMGINKFADLTPEEMSRFHMGLKPRRDN